MILVEASASWGSAIAAAANMAAALSTLASRRFIGMTPIWKVVGRAGKSEGRSGSGRGCVIDRDGLPPEKFGEVARVDAGFCVDLTERGGQQGERSGHRAVLPQPSLGAHDVAVDAFVVLIELARP